MSNRFWTINQWAHVFFGMAWMAMGTMLWGPAHAGPMFAVLLLFGWGKEILYDFAIKDVQPLLGAHGAFADFGVIMGGAGIAILAELIRTLV